MSKTAQGFTIKQHVSEIDETLMQDLPLADFIEEFSDLYAAEIEQGQTF